MSETKSNLPININYPPGIDVTNPLDIKGVETLDKMGKEDLMKLIGMQLLSQFTMYIKLYPIKNKGCAFKFPLRIYMHVDSLYFIIGGGNMPNRRVTYGESEEANKGFTGLLMFAKLRDEKEWFTIDIQSARRTVFKFNSSEPFIYEG